MASAANDTPPFKLEVDEHGHVLLTRREIGPTAIDLGPEAEACCTMADFLAQRDFGDCG